MYLTTPMLESLMSKECKCLSLLIFYFGFDFPISSYRIMIRHVCVNCVQSTDKRRPNGARGAGVFCAYASMKQGGGKGLMYISMRYQAPEFFSLVQSLLPEFSAVSARGGGANWQRGHPLGVGWEIRQLVNNSSSVRECINRIQLVPKRVSSNVEMQRLLLLWCSYVAENPQWQKLH